MLLHIPLLFMLQALREHELEVEALSSSHAEASRALRYHLHMTRSAMRRVIGSVDGFKKQVSLLCCSPGPAISLVIEDHFIGMTLPHLLP